MICYALNAREEELIALTCGRFSSSKLPDGATMGDIEATLLLVQSGKLRGMEELLYWTMARQAWEMPARDPALLTLLTEIYLFTAQHSRLHERWTEIPPYLDKATAVIGELPASSADLKLRIRLEILRATVAVHEGATLRPHRGLHILSAALERSNDLPDFQAWILSDMAKYLEMDGRTEASLEMAKKAIPVAAEAANPIEAELRQMDYGNHLLRAGRPAEALRVLPGAECIGPEVLLVRAEAEFQAENLSEAANTLQKAMEQIERENIVHLRAKAERLAARL
jgi:tetratricopeptide (TPR) repeat protein